MGGRLDATNVVEPRVSVITDISLDHQKFLGDTIREIAREKAGIVRPNGVRLEIEVDSYGRPLRRIRIFPDGRRFVLFENRPIAFLMLRTQMLVELIQAAPKR